MRGSKDKQLVKKAQPKRLAIASLIQRTGVVEDQRIILEQLAALERAQEHSPGGSSVLGSTPRG